MVVLTRKLSADLAPAANEKGFTVVADDGRAKRDALDGRLTARVTRMQDAGATAITAGNDHACAILDSGSLSCWGFDAAGQLGAGDTEMHATPVTVLTQEGTPLGDVADVGVGWDASCARSTRGEVWCWGGNASGQLGDGTSEARTRAVRVPLAAHADHASVGFNRACAVLATGDVWKLGEHIVACGDAQDGALLLRLLGERRAATVG